MKKTALALVLSLTVIAAMVAQTAPSAPATQEPPAGTYTIDPAHATIGFVVRHLDISDIAGKFNSLEGAFTLGGEPAFNAIIQIDSVDTGVEKRDEHLKSKDFFDAAQFPTIEFRSKMVEQAGDSYTVVGDFTMHGETKEITLPLRYLGTAEFHGQRAGFTGELTIDRRDWGLTAWQGMVGNDIKLMVSFEGIKQ